MCQAQNFSNLGLMKRDLGFSLVVLHGTKGWMKGKYSILNGLFTQA